MFTENEPAVEPITDADAEKDLQVPAFADPANPTAEEAQAVATIAQSALAQKKHWRGKAIDPVTGKPYKDLIPAKENNNNAPHTPAVATPKLEETVAGLQLSEEKRSFGYTHKLSPEESDVVFSFAKGNGIKPSEALNHSFVKAGIEAMRRDNANAAATPGASHRAPVVEGKTFGSMKSEDRRKNFGAVVAAAQGR